MTLASPLWLWLLAALPAIGLLAWRNRAARTRQRLAVATLLRSLTLVLLALACARPVLLEHSREISVVYAIDVSKSIAPAFVRQTIDWIRAENARHHPAQVRYVVFASQARLLESADDVLAIPVSADGEATPGSLDQGATDLEQALRTALFGFAPDHARRLVLVSDGNQTHGDVWRALARLRAEHVRLFAVPATVAVSNDAWVEAISLPQGVRQQEPVRASVNVFSRARTRARVELADGSRVLGARSAALDAGENEIAFQIRLPDAGSNVLTARVSAEGDEDTRNDTLSESVWVGPRPARAVRGKRTGERTLSCRCAARSAHRRHGHQSRCHER
jgi:hypothetical protein